MIDALGGTLPGDLVVLPQECRQLQRLEVVSEQDFGGVSVMRRAPTAGSCTTWRTSLRPGRAAGTIDVEVEPGRPPLDAAQYQVLHRIKADCAEPQGVADRTLDLLEPEGLQ